jgi:hypothetical protein
MKRVIAVLATICCLLTWVANAPAQVGLQISNTKTNWVDRWITNTTEVHMQVNRFITEFHTNWIKRVETNFVDLFATNTVTRYQTNLVTQFRTNFVKLFATNLVTKTATNILVVDALATNFVQAYRTNLKTLNLTNWTTVVAFKTNWIERPLTNLVEIEMTRDAAPAGIPPAKPSTGNEPLSLQATRSARLTANNQVEVQLKVSWTRPPATPLQVQQWRIERQDGSILCIGQDPEFKRALPEGTYKVSVKAQRDARSPVVAALGTLTVTSREVLLEQRPARSNSST